MSKLTHLDEAGRAAMVNVAEKPVTRRKAIAQAVVAMPPETLALIMGGQVPKGDVLAVARVAGIMAAKRTSDLIPLCHPLSLSRVAVSFSSDRAAGLLTIEAEAEVDAQTGVEMEALTAVSVAALTVYDMVKSASRGLTIGPVRLLSKEGGASGRFVAGDESIEAPSTPEPAPKKRTAARTAKAVPVRARTIMSATAAPKPDAPASSTRERVRRFMAANKLQVTGWAEAAGLAPSTLYSYLHGRLPRLSAEDQARLAKAAGVSPRDLFGQ